MFCCMKSSAIMDPSFDAIIWKDTVPFVAPVNSGKVIKVYDGDTITIATTIPFQDKTKSNTIYRFSVRLMGIDSPEIHGKTEEERTAAKLSQEALETLILDKIVTLKNVKTEKYGRLLANVYVGRLHLNNYMLKNNYAVPYDGGKKTTFEKSLEK